MAQPIAAQRGSVLEADLSIDAAIALPEILRNTEDELRKRNWFKSLGILRLRHPISSRDQEDVQVLENAHGILRDLQELVRRPSAVDDHLAAIVHDHMLDVIDLLAGLIGREAKAPAAVTLKILWAVEGGEPCIHTLLRDRVSWEVREGYGPPDKFEWRSNTAFRAIIENQAGIPFWGCNNLLSLENRRAYENRNERWKFLYNSVAVMGIPPRGRPGLVGFLCADSLLGRVNTPRVFRLLAVMAQHLYDVLGQCLVLLQRTQPRPPDREASEILLDPELGWRLEEGHLRATNQAQQDALQTALGQFDDYYQRFSTTRAASAFPRWERTSPPAPMKGQSMDDSDYAAISPDDPLPPRLAALLNKDPISDEEFDRILSEIAANNPYAQTILRHRRKTAE